jgi:hypothetical protein
VKAKRLKTLQAIFRVPTCASLTFSDIESLVVALGGEVVESEGSRVKITINGAVWRTHRPHPGKEAKKYQVEELRELLELIGITPDNAGERE